MKRRAARAIREHVDRGPRFRRDFGLRPPISLRSIRATVLPLTLSVLCPPSSGCARIGPTRRATTVRESMSPAPPAPRRRRTRGNTMRLDHCRAALIGAAIALTARSAGAQTKLTNQGITDTEIALGTHQDLSGPIKGWGVAVANGMKMAVDQIKAARGRHGPKLQPP